LQGLHAVQTLGVWCKLVSTHILLDYAFYHTSCPQLQPLMGCD
jgi:hypothetical protein